ncbi:UDP-3-O-[3-hydroxymyristoyl] glucosamine N-acyltransferase [Thermodesulfobium acidiphilum]|uniref:UDP-3-O-[3-hydroxymyristoyl] glucosamine N-acyltransferase n=1 Tax=Thermodesulfobium acidiphilum TaxID=1794699 RepID=A0A2R4VY48_THEAF|nr:UDP-3-O-(3-hydroxymyristoyl)glucosamine N-acyltransferase [Thermodesulfobium acidiphilum]AWB09447.1 UDP-3-O-[3-hydroxymyristoyl] glucosamine N-acyltransferase [Thermodesulfobium acidiphilum]
MVSKLLSEIAKEVGGVLRGEDLEVTDIKPLNIALEKDLSFVLDKANSEASRFSKAGAFLCYRGFESDRATIEVDLPKLALSKVLNIFYPRNFREPLIHTSSVISEGAKISSKAYVGPYCVIEDGAVIEDMVELVAFIYVGKDVYIGKGTRIFPFVCIREKCRIGENCVIQAGATIGNDGFGYATDSYGHHTWIPQIGGVSIGSEVDIGSNTTIDRGSFVDTIIKDNVKVDNLVQIAHNCILEKSVILVSMVGLSGSVHVKENAVLAGKVGVKDHLTIGKGATVLAKSGLMKDVPDGSTVMGYPARHYIDFFKERILIERLPEIEKRIKKLEEQIEILKCQDKSEEV